MDLLEVEVLGRQFLRALIICLTAKIATGMTISDSKRNTSPPVKRQRGAQRLGPTFQSPDAFGCVQLIQVRVYDKNDFNEFEGVELKDDNVSEVHD